LPLPNQENKNREEMRTHELSLVETYDPIVQVEKSVHAFECTTILIGSQNTFAGMEISSGQCWPFYNGDN
jgi:hypothetical protein